MGRGHLSSDFCQPVTFDVFYFFLEVKHKSSTVIIGFVYSNKVVLLTLKLPRFHGHASVIAGQELQHYIVAEALSLENARRASSDRGQVNPCGELSVPIVTAGAEGGAVLLKFFTA